VKTALTKQASVGVSPIHGFGLFAGGAIAASDVVDESPVLLIEGRLPRAITGHVYVMADGRRALPCGDGIFVNHSRAANTVPKFDLRRRVVKLVALRAITAGEEVTVDYGPGWD
jgi:hypothetical protein